MYVTLFAALIISHLTLTSSRFLKKDLETTTLLHATPIVRMTRQIYDDDTLTGFSKEDAIEEGIKIFERRQINSSELKILPTEIAKFRNERESVEVLPPPKNETKTYLTSPSEKQVLVKKPIPKFNEHDSDVSFQTKVKKGPAGIVETIEREDEDFNIEDYDFDINHDDFSSSNGKPLEHNLELKQNSINRDIVALAKDTNQNDKGATVFPKNNKRKKSIDKVKEDYYDDITTTTPVKNSTDYIDLDGEIDETKGVLKKIADYEKYSWLLRKKRYAKKRTFHLPMFLIEEKKKSTNHPVAVEFVAGNDA